MIKLHRKCVKKEMLPTKLCPGCGHGVLANILVTSIVESLVDSKKVVFVYSAGCTKWAFGSHIEIDSIEVPSQTAIAFGVGMQKADPDLKVIVVLGDNELNNDNLVALINAARKSVNIRVICANNNISAFLEGHVSGTTPVGAITSNLPSSNMNPPLDFCKIIAASDAQYVARFSILNLKNIMKSLKIALNSKGLSFIEVLTTCPTYYGKLNSMGSSVEMLKSLRINCVLGDIIRNTSQKGFSEPVFVGENIKR